MGGAKSKNCLTQSHKSSFTRMKFFTSTSFSSLRGVVKNIPLTRKGLECFFFPSVCHFVHLASLLPPCPALSKLLKTILTWCIQMGQSRMLKRWIMVQVIEGGCVCRCQDGYPKENITFHRLVAFVTLNRRPSFDLPVTLASAGVCH